jgi:DNA helicase-2/ATP-dependent DNA helicase PcrA
MTLNDFLATKKSLMIAAAGHGKTHCIAECISRCDTSQRQLILTHTHAGISSLKQKLMAQGVDCCKYDIQTITGFAQRLVFAYCNQSQIPFKQEEKAYFTWIMSKALELLTLNPLSFVIQNSYQGLFVDEYQDCDINQHKLIVKMSEYMPTHLFGDPLQGIFDFNGEKVNFERDLQDFTRFDLLKTPWRWNKTGNNAYLGQYILRTREILLSNEQHIQLIDSPNYGIHLICAPHDEDGSWYKLVSAIIHKISGNSILIIVPSYYDENLRMRGNTIDRANLRTRLSIQDYLLIEAIDQEDYYSSAKVLDIFVDKFKRARKKNKAIYDLLDINFKVQKTGLNDWINKDSYSLKTKRGELRDPSLRLQNMFQTFNQSPCIENLHQIIRFFIIEQKATCKRPGLAWSLLKCISMSISNRNTVYENMVAHKNKIRMSGRKVDGKCIGTTLLTKGLEFDTVVVLDAHLFEDKRNFYVAISRACKQLYIITEQKRIHLRD